MKKYVLNKMMDIIKNNYPYYGEDKLEEIKYGLEGVYLTITKIIFIFTFAYYIGVFKEMLMLLLFYNLLRFTGFGLHASKSIYCLISSSTIFIGLPFIIKYINIVPIIRLILAGISVGLFLIYAPADTERRPLINRKRRLIYKYITVLTSIIYSYFIFTLNNEIYSNTLLFAMIVELLMILPVTYKLFNLKFNNYKTYSEEY